MPTPFAFPRFYPLGDGAVVVECGGGISADTLGYIQALARQLAATRWPALRETVPGYTTLTVFYDPARLPGPATPYEQLTAWLRVQLAAAETRPTSTEPGVALELPVCYGGACGPDLAAVAQHAGLPEAEVIARHAAPTYLVHLLGFLPGFAYLGGLDASLATPRRATPRARVPAGAVGIAGAQTGVYPLASPGGWQLIGRTPLRLFTPDGPQPTLLMAGQRLRFVPITEAEFHRRNEYEH